MRMFLTYKKQLLAGMLILCTGFVGGMLFEGGTHSHSYRSFRDYDSGYEYIAPLLFVGIDEGQAFPKYRPLKNAIENFAERMTREGKVEEVSVYFRNLNTSQWVAANIDERYAPASMLKVATLLAVLEQVEEDPETMTRRVKVTASGGTPSSQEYYPPEHPIQPGNVYTVEELITHLIKESDNLANSVLVNMTGTDRIARVYHNLELTPPSEGREEGYSAQEYSRLYRTLYNSTYLSRPLSEYALALLSDTTFTQGVVQGVPDTVRVSHKFGVHTIVSDPGLLSEKTHHELHDCGIVYAERETRTLSAS